MVKRSSLVSFASAAAVLTALLGRAVTVHSIGAVPVILPAEDGQQTVQARHVNGADGAGKGAVAARKGAATAPDPLCNSEDPVRTRTAFTPFSKNGSPGLPEGALGKRRTPERPSPREREAQTHLELENRKRLLATQARQLARRAVKGVP